MKVMCLHCRLRSLKKGTSSMRSYIAQVKEVCDLLATCGSKVSEVEQLATILNGLSMEYDPFVAVITGSREQFTLKAATSVLIDAEMRVSDPQRLPVRINMLQHSSMVNANSQLQNNVSSQALHPRNYNGKPRPYRYGDSSSRYRGKSRPQCQLCGKLGHTVDRCWHRFDHNFQGVAAQHYASQSPQANVSYFSNSPAIASHCRCNLDICYNPFVGKPAAQQQVVQGLPIDQVANYGGVQVESDAACEAFSNDVSNQSILEQAVPTVSERSENAAAPTLDDNI
ncbi:hypothetical protein GQ457_15G011510 [Hibiscus cannabinus]